MYKYIENMLENRHVAIFPIFSTDCEKYFLINVVNFTRLWIYSLFNFFPSGKSFKYFPCLNDVLYIYLIVHIFTACLFSRWFFHFFLLLLLKPLQIYSSAQYLNPFTFCFQFITFQISTFFQQNPETRHILK